MQTVVAKLAGVPLEQSSVNAWGFTDGVDPYQGIFEVHNNRVERILSASDGKLVKLEIKRDGGGSLEVDGLDVLGLWPTNKEWTSAVLVSDARWTWERPVVPKEYNVRRRTGNTVRLGANNDVRGVTLPEVQYAPWSLNGLIPWTAIEVLKDVLQRVTKGRFDVSGVNASKALPIENLILDDSGSSAVQRVLHFLPGNGVYIDARGYAVVYDKLDLSAAAKVIEGAKRRKIFGAALPERVTFERTRPAEVVCLFDRETEIRVDYVETAAGAQVFLVLDPKEQRQCQNVLPCPDPTLAIPGGSWGPARVVNMGTWITFDEFFAALAAAGNAPTFFGDPLPAFSADILRQLYTPIGGLLLMVYAGANVAPDPVWTRRITTAMAHYRQTFRLPPRWRDKIKGMRANRVRVVDTVNGERAPADVWVDYCVRPTLKRLADQPGNGQLFGWNVYAIGTDQSQDLAKQDLSTVQAARNAKLSVVDNDQGVFRIDFQRSPDLGDADVLPGAVDNLPNADPSEQILTWEYAKLSATHRMAAIFTVSQAAPNDERRFHAVRVTPSQAEKALGLKLGADAQGNASVGLGACKGPTWYLRIGLPAARFGWDDAKGFPQAFDNAYGAGEAAAAPSTVDATASPLNPGGGDVKLADLGTPTNDDEVNAVALAAAASLYASMIDRYEGGLTTTLDPAVKIAGSINGVLHSLSQEGLPTTTLSLPPTLAPTDMWALVPDQIRRKIKGQVLPPA